jgi:hypothetical protein
MSTISVQVVKIRPVMSDLRFFGIDCASYIGFTMLTSNVRRLYFWFFIAYMLMSS